MRLVLSMPSLKRQLKAKRETLIASALAVIVHSGRFSFGAHDDSQSQIRDGCTFPNKHCISFNKQSNLRTTVTLLLLIVSLRVSSYGAALVARMPLCAVPVHSGR